MKSIIFGLLLACISTQVSAQTVKGAKDVIPGRLIRAGTTNQAPYSDDTLRNLCEQGYTLAIYVYAGGRNTDVSCSKGTIAYRNITSWQTPEKTLPLIGQALGKGGKVVVHCWNGVHASNYVTALSLNKFCGYSGSQTATAWRNGFNGGIPQSTINKLSGQLSALPGGGSVMEGCPTPR